MQDKADEQRDREDHPQHVADDLPAIATASATKLSPEEAVAFQASGWRVRGPRETSERAIRVARRQSTGLGKIDPHKASHAACAIDRHEVELAQLSVPWP